MASLQVRDSTQTWHVTILHVHSPSSAAHEWLRTVAGDPVDPPTIIGIDHYGADFSIPVLKVCPHSYSDLRVQACRHVPEYSKDWPWSPHISLRQPIQFSGDCRLVYVP